MAENFIDCTYISENYAALDVKDAGNISKLIEKFDQGHSSISLVENGQFKGLLDIFAFHEGLSTHKFNIYPTAYLNYSIDDNLNKRQALQFFSMTRFREVPLIKDGKIMAVAVNTATIGAIHKFNDVEFPPIYWNLIGDDLAESVFGGKKILISSDQGNLSGFKERFGDIAEIESLNLKNWNKHLEDYYDLFLYGSVAVSGGGGGVN